MISSSSLDENKDIGTMYIRFWDIYTYLFVNKDVKSLFIHCFVHLLLSN